MLPAIGFMVGLYVMTRMFELIIPKTEGKENVVVLIFAALTIIVAVYGIYVLFTQGVNLSGLRY